MNRGKYKSYLSTKHVDSGTVAYMVSVAVQRSGNWCGTLLMCNVTVAIQPVSPSFQVVKLRMLCVSILLQFLELKLYNRNSKHALQ